VTASGQPVLTRYRGNDFSEMSFQIASGNRPCVICREPIKRGSTYLYAVVRVSKTTSRRHICRACCLRKLDSELCHTWNRLLNQGTN